MQKTNAIRILEKNEILFETLGYEVNEFKGGAEISVKLGEDINTVFKTLVCKGKSKTHYVFIIPVLDSLDMKKAALVAKEKSVELLPLNELTKVTGYIRGGCSPIGMKKVFKTFIDNKALTCSKILISAGKIGEQIKLNPVDLKKILPIEFCDIVEV